MEDPSREFVGAAAPVVVKDPFRELVGAAARGVMAGVGVTTLCECKVCRPTRLCGGRMSVRRESVQAGTALRWESECEALTF